MIMAQELGFHPEGVCIIALAIAFGLIFYFGGRKPPKK